MRLLSNRLRLLLVCSIVALFAASCDLDLGTNDDDPPTAVVITSTPTEASGAAPTETQQDDSATTAPTSDAAPTETGPEATPTPSNGQPTATPADDTDPALAEIEAIEADVVELRGLEQLEDIDVQIIDRQELSQRVQIILEDDYSVEEARLDALSYWLLRLIPDQSIDLYQLQADLLSEQIAGYYDPDTNELVVVTESGELGVTDKLTMAHEIVHALQDQHFDLVAVDENATDADHSAALTALIEGDATLAMTEYMFEYLDLAELASLLGESLAAPDTEVLDSAPRYISEGLLFSYEAGQAFTTRLFETGGYSAINDAFSDPPSSTEQILHPEKYLDEERDDPVEVGNPDVSGDLGDGWELVRSDSLGEWDFQIMLEDNGVTGQEVAQATAGWGGSSFDIYESGDGALALLTTRWDSDVDAAEFAGALQSSFEVDAEAGAVWSEDGREFSIVTGGDTVVLISGTDRQAVEAALAIIEQTV